MTKYIDIVFDGPPSHESGRFVEVENDKGESIRFGEWVERPDGYWALRFTPPTQGRAEIERLRQVLGTVPCPAGGWTGMPKELEGNCTVTDCLNDKSCGCTFGAALSPHIGGPANE